MFKALYTHIQLFPTRDRQLVWCHYALEVAPPPYIFYREVNSCVSPATAECAWNSVLWFPLQIVMAPPHHKEPPGSQLVPQNLRKDSHPTPFTWIFRKQHHSYTETTRSLPIEQGIYGAKGTCPLKDYASLLYATLRLTKTLKLPAQVPQLCVHGLAIFFLSFAFLRMDKTTDGHNPRPEW